MNNHLSAEEFWKIIDEISDCDRVGVAERLSHLKLPQLAGFSVAFQTFESMLDSDEYAWHLPTAGNSDDGFLYVRNAVVLSGKKSFDGIIKNTKKISKFDDVWAAFMCDLCETLAKDHFGITENEWDILEDNTKFDTGLPRQKFRVTSVCFDEKINDQCLDLAKDAIEFNLKRFKIYFWDSAYLKVTLEPASHENSFKEKIETYYKGILKFIKNSNLLIDSDELLKMQNAPWYLDDLAERNFKFDSYRAIYSYNCEKRILSLTINSKGGNKINILRNRESFTSALDSIIKPKIIGGAIHINENSHSDFYIKVAIDLSAHEKRNYRADEGHPHMMFRLGELLLEESPEKARYWLKESAAKGFKLAGGILRQLDEGSTL